MTQPSHDIRHPVASETILNVDDSEAGRYVKSHVLRSAGYRVIEAGTGRDVLRLARESKPQLIVLDVKLPDRDGFDICRELKGDPATASIMILLVSAVRVRREDKVAGLEEGADGYLIEPIEPDELLATVKALLRLYRSEQRLHLALKATNDVVWDYDVSRDAFMWNEAGTAVFGWEDPASRPVDMVWWVERVHPDDRQRVREGFQKALVDPAVEYWHDHYRFQTKSGSYADVYDRSYIVRKEQGLAERIIGAMQDVTGSKRAQEALRQSEERFRRSADATGALVFEADPLDRTVPVTIHGLERLLGIDPAEMRRDFHWWFSLIHPDDRARYNAELEEQLRTGGARTVSYRVRHPAGRWLHVESSREVILDEKGKPVKLIGAVVDVTQRKQAEEALVTRSRQQQILYELASVVNRADALSELYERSLDAILSSLRADRASILLFDEQGTMRFKAWRQLSDAYRQAVEGHSPWKPDATDLEPILLANIADAGLDAPLQSVIEAEGIRALAFIPLTYGGRLIGKFMVYFDRPHIMSPDDLSLAQAIAGTLAIGIERKRAEDRLRLSEERFRLATETGKVGVWEWDIEQDAITWTDSLYGIHGIRRGEIPMTVEGFSSLVHPDDRSRLSDAIHAALAKNWPYELEFRSVRPDGAIAWIFTSAVVLRDGERAVRMIGATVDITQSKRAAEELRLWSAELERRVHERTKALQQSHERVRAMATELNLTEQRERKRMAGELHDHLAQMLVLGRLKLSQAKRLPDLSPACGALLAQTADVLDKSLTYTRTLVAELSPPVLHDFGLSPALKWLGEQMQRHDLNVTVEVAEEGTSRLPNDQAMLLFQSVRELLLNASKHAQSRNAWVSLARRDGELRIQVRDEGKGFDPQAAMTSSSKTSELSSKFGLFSIRERMLALGGRFELISSPESGTTATLTLPVEHEASAPAERAQPHRTVRSMPYPAQPASKVRVLLVDDHAMMRQGLKSVLDGYADVEVVGEAANGEEAILCVERHRPAVVVMDINMPKKNGIEAAADITARYPEIHIIGLSINSSVENVAAMHEAGAKKLLTKEAAVDELYRAIQDVLTRP